MSPEVLPRWVTIRRAADYYYYYYQVSQPDPKDHRSRSARCSPHRQLPEHPHRPGVAPAPGPIQDLGHVTTRRYITIAEAADYLQISDRIVRRLIADGELTGYRMGRSRRLIRVDLNKIDEQLMRPLNEPPRSRRRRA